MRHAAFSMIVLGALSIPGRVDAQTPFSVDARVGDFHVAVANYYQVPQREVVVIHERRVRDEEIPVVLFIAQHAHVAPATIADLRMRGLSWWDISVRYGIGPEVYYVPVAVVPGPPYGKAWGHYKKKPRKQWNTIVLADDDVVNLVQVRFISDYYRIPPERVFEVHGHHPDIIAVNYEVSRSQSHRHDDDDDHGKGKRQSREGQRKAQVMTERLVALGLPPCQNLPHSLEASGGPSGPPCEEAADVHPAHFTSHRGSSCRGRVLAFSCESLGAVSPKRELVLGAAHCVGRSRYSRLLVVQRRCEHAVRTAG